MTNLVAGRHELEDLPVHGSMGEVFAAYDRRVALKRLHADLVNDAEMIRRFEREARLTARVRHPGVPAVFDVGVDSYGPYLVLEYIDGHTLADLVNEVCPLIDALTADRPQDRPPDARTVIDLLMPMVVPVPSLPGFVTDARDVPAHVARYTAAKPAPRAVAVTAADLPHLRRHAARHVAGGRLGLGLALLDHLIHAMSRADDPVTMDLRWDRARWLFEAGDMTRSAKELSTLAVHMIDRLGPTHPVAVSARLMNAHTQAACGRVREALAVLQPLLDDLTTTYGPRDPRLYPTRLELGIQLAVAGDRALAVATLTALADDQRRDLGSHHADLASTLDALSAI